MQSSRLFVVAFVLAQFPLAATHYYGCGCDDEGEGRGAFCDVCLQIWQDVADEFPGGVSDVPVRNVSVAALSSCREYLPEPAALCPALLAPCVVAELVDAVSQTPNAMIVPEAVCIGNGFCSRQ